MKTKLYGLAEGVLGRHVVNKSPAKVMRMLPADVRSKCHVIGDEIRGYRACDG